MVSARALALLTLLTTPFTALPVNAYHNGDDTPHCYVNKKIQPFCPDNDKNIILWDKMLPMDGLVGGETYDVAYHLDLSSFGDSIVLKQNAGTGPFAKLTHYNLHACLASNGFCDWSLTNTTKDGQVLVTTTPSSPTNETALTGSTNLPPGVWVVIAHVRFFVLNATNTSQSLQYDVARAMYRTFNSPIVNQDVTFSSPLGIFFMVINGLGILCSVITLIFLAVYRNHNAIRATSPVLSAVILIGIIMGFATIFTYTGVPSQTSCIAQPWITTLAFSITVSMIAAKNYRIHIIFNSPKMSQKNITDLRTMLPALIFVFCNILILIIWSVYRPPTPSSVLIGTSQWTACFSDTSNPAIQTAFNGVLFALNGVLMVGTTWLAYSTRNVNGAFNESKWIALTSYQILTWSLLGLLIVFIASLGNQIIYIIRSAVLLIISMSAFCLLYLPKYKLVFYPEMDSAKYTQSGRAAPGPASSAIASMANNSHNKENSNPNRYEPVYVKKSKTLMYMSVTSKYRITYVPDERTLLFKAANGNLNAVTLKKVEVLDDKMKGSDGLKCVARINATEYYEFVFDDKSTAERFIYMMRGAFMQAGAGSSNAKSSVGGGQNSMVGSVPAYMHMNTGGVGGGPVFANFPPTPPSATVIPKSSSVNAIAHLHGTSLKTSEIGNV